MGVRVLSPGRVQPPSSANAIEIIPRFQLQWSAEEGSIAFVPRSRWTSAGVLRIYIYVPLFHRACQFRDCISARITASTTSSSSLDCIPNLRFILYARTVSGMGLKRFPPTRRTARLIRLQLYTCFSLWTDFDRVSSRNRFKSRRRKVFCYRIRNTFAGIIYTRVSSSHSFSLFFSLEQF